MVSFGIIGKLSEHILTLLSMIPGLLLPGIVITMFIIILFLILSFCAPYNGNLKAEKEE